MDLMDEPPAGAIHNPVALPPSRTSNVRTLDLLAAGTDLLAWAEALERNTGQPTLAPAKLIGLIAQQFLAKKNFHEPAARAAGVVVIQKIIVK